MTTHAEVWDGGAKAARSDTPKIYVACLASYNAGGLHGRWIDATQDVDEILEEIRDMLALGPTPGAEEFAIHDHEGFGPYRIHEYESIEKVAELAAGIAEHGEAFAIYAAHVGSIEDATEGFQDAYCGEWRDGAEYAEQSLNDMYAVPDYLASYIDYGRVWHDWSCGDHWIEKGHVFRAV